MSVCFQSPGGGASEIFAKLEVHLWLGLAKYSKEATGSLPQEFLPVFEEEEEEQRRLVPTGFRKLPLSLSCQGESADLLDPQQRAVASDKHLLLPLQTAGTSSCAATYIRAGA